MRFKYKIQLKLYSIKRGLSNLIEWLPVIWNDRQWGAEYIYKILLKKLKLKEEFFYNERIDKVQTEEIVTQLRYVIAALERLIKNDYLPAKDFIDIDKGTVDHQSWRLAESKLMQKDIAFVFDSMKKNIGNWWD